jgi:glycosyltransferase involved in cell wall biosynthesis
MAKRTKIGILLNYSTKWMGGIIYILNFIRTMDKLPDDEKPEITLFYNKNLTRFLSEINYPDIKFVEWKFPSAYKAYFNSWIMRKNYFISGILDEYELDCLYPIHDFPIKTESRVRLIAWYADLQHKHYPEFFPFRKRLERDFRNRLMLKNCDRLVLSSQAVADDFSLYYPRSKETPVSIYHFVSIIEKESLLEDIDELKARYQLPNKYFFVANQFAKHKNHKVILQALTLLKKEGLNIHIVFTGRLPNRETSEYISTIYDIIENEELSDCVSFLGLLPRSEQVTLMKNSISVIQPSLFEGWSTVNEDALALDVPVIASDIQVNKEQLGLNGVYFDPYDMGQLASLLKMYYKDCQAFEFDYNKRIDSALRSIKEIFLWNN